MTINRLRMPIDILITILSTILMGGTILFQDGRVHQVMGIFLLALWICHTILNRHWFASLFTGKYQPYRILQTFVNIGVCSCALILMISGLLLEWFMPAELVGGAFGYARITHLLSSHWYYIFMAFHLGLHAAMIAGKMKIHGTAPRVIFILISIYGVYAFIIRGVWKYMFGLQKFFFFDFDRGYFLFALDYVSIIILFATIAYYLRKIL